MELAKDHGVTELVIYNDNRMPVNHVNGNFKVKQEHLIPIVAKTRERVLTSCPSRSAGRAVRTPRRLMLCVAQSIAPASMARRQRYIRALPLASTHRSNRRGWAGPLLASAADRCTGRRPALRAVGPEQRASCEAEGAASAATNPSWETGPSGQSGQRRSLAQHGPSGLRAVAGAASAASAAASSPPRKRAPRRRQGRPRPGREMSPFAPAHRRCPMEKAIQGHPRPNARGCVWRPSARPGDVPRSG